MYGRLFLLITSSHQNVVHVCERRRARIEGFEVFNQERRQ